MERIRVPGATGYLDTDYQAKAEYALKHSVISTSSTCMWRLRMKRAILEVSKKR